MKKNALRPGKGTPSQEENHLETSDKIQRVCIGQDYFRACGLPKCTDCTPERLVVVPWASDIDLAKVAAQHADFTEELLSIASELEQVIGSSYRRITVKSQLSALAKRTIRLARQINTSGGLVYFNLASRDLLKSSGQTVTRTDV